MVHWKSILVTANMTVREIISVIDESSLQIALVIDDNRKLLGSITDGDIRRGLIAGVRMDEAVKKIMNTEPYCAQEHYDRDELLQAMMARRLYQVPVVDDDGCVMDLVIIDDLFKGGVDRKNWVVLMAGGLGTRLHPLTNTTPKPLIDVGGKPILERILESFVSKGFKRFYISVNYKSEMIKSYFADGEKWGVEIRYLEETEALGTAGALSLIPEIPSEPLIVMNGDLMTEVDFSKLLDFHVEHKAKCTMGVREYDFQVEFGVVEIENGVIARINEKPVHTFLVNAGIYTLEPSVVQDIPNGTVMDMPQLFDELIAKGAHACAFPIHEYWLDIGRTEDLDRARQKALTTEN